MANTAFVRYEDAGCAMPGLVKGIRDWFRAAAAIDVQRAREEAARTMPRCGAFVAAGREVRCLHCGGRSFTVRGVSIHSNAAAAAHMEWFGPEANALTCEACSRMEFFSQPLTPVGDAPAECAA